MTSSDLAALLVAVMLASYVRAVGPVEAVNQLLRLLGQ